jgi:aryl-alcohol dehydrogenase-like predicted oxidoreductase
LERRRLGRSGLDVPVIGMGTWRTFDTDDDRSWLVSEAIGAGVDLFDSSPMYGRAEDTLARALEGRRGDVLVATKVWTDDDRPAAEQVEHALSLYGTVDVYQVHNLVATERRLTTLEQLKTSGRVRAIGATDYREAQFPELVRWMRSGRLDMVQVPYNPLRPRAAQEVLPVAEELGIGVFVMSPLQGGILDRHVAPEQLAELGVATWPQAVLKWIASDPRVSCVLTATSKPGRIASNAAAGDPPWFDADQRNLVARLAAG